MNIVVFRPEKGSHTGTRMRPASFSRESLWVSKFTPTKRISPKPSIWTLAARPHLHDQGLSIDRNASAPTGFNSCRWSHYSQSLALLSGAWAIEEASEEESTVSDAQT